MRLIVAGSRDILDADLVAGAIKASGWQPTGQSPGKRRAS